MTLVLKTGGDPVALTPSVRDAIGALDARIPVTGVATFETRIRESLSGARIGLLLLVVFGAAAALIAAVGIYGVLAYAVARRTGEIGTRMALGAAPNTVLRSVVQQAMRLWLIGTIVGVGTSFVTADILRRYVPGIETGSVTTYVGAFGALGLIALLAATIPARRATAVDPVEALRAE
jgi:ABC-type antimicrobial peptide transport system permease subunit